jgi:thymidine kinase
MDSPIEAYTGNIQLILGPMFAGKSSELLRRVSRYQIAKKSCILIKYIHDNRYDNRCIATHDHYIKNDGTQTIATQELFTVQHMTQDYEVIGIDEGQFFIDLLPFCEQAANNGKIVIVSALDGDFLRKPFGSVCDLIPLAEHVVKLKAVCMMCQRDAAFSRRLTTEQQTEVIGGADKYIAVCRKCYNMSVDLSPQKKKRSIESNNEVKNEATNQKRPSPKPIRFVENPSF